MSLASPEEDNQDIAPGRETLTEADLAYCMLICNPREELLRTCICAIVNGSNLVVGLPALRARLGACFEQCNFQRRVSAAHHVQHGWGLTLRSGIASIPSLLVGREFQRHGSALPAPLCDVLWHLACSGVLSMADGRCCRPQHCVTAERLHGVFGAATCLALCWACPTCHDRTQAEPAAGDESWQHAERLWVKPRGILPGTRPALF